MEPPESLPTALESLVDDLLEVVDEGHREQIVKSIRMAYAFGYMVGLRCKTHALVSSLEPMLQLDDLVTTA